MPHTTNVCHEVLVSCKNHSPKFYICVCQTQHCTFQTNWVDQQNNRVTNINKLCNQVINYMFQYHKYPQNRHNQISLNINLTNGFPHIHPTGIIHKHRSLLFSCCDLYLVIYILKKVNMKINGCFKQSPPCYSHNNVQLLCTFDGTSVFAFDNSKHGV